jgi:hypothetical protein
MAPPSSKPKLDRLDPAEVAQAVAIAVLEHAQALVQGLLTPAFEGVQLERGGAASVGVLARQTRVYSVVLELAEYALHGRKGAGFSVQASLGILLALWPSTVGFGGTVDGLCDHADSGTPLGLVIHAAQAREQLALGHPVTAQQLAALAGLSATQVRLLCRSGAIPSAVRQVSARDALRWLEGRGVSGFTQSERRGGRHNAA